MDADLLHFRLSPAVYRVFFRPGSGGNNVFLPLFFGRILFHKQRLAGEGVLAGIIHERGKSGRGGGENLDLLGMGFQVFTDEPFQGRHLFLGASGVGCHKIIG